MKKSLLCGTAAILMTAWTVTTVKPANPRTERDVRPAATQPEQSVAAIERSRHVEAAG